MEQKVWEDVCRDLLEAMDALGIHVHEFRGQVLLSLYCLVGRRLEQMAVSILVTTECVPSVTWFE